MQRYVCGTCQDCHLFEVFVGNSSLRCQYAAHAGGLLPLGRFVPESTSNLLPKLHFVLHIPSISLVQHAMLPSLRKILAVTLTLASTAPGIVQAAPSFFDADRYWFTNCHNAPDGYSFCLYFPPSYKPSDRDKWPLLMFLTGSGARGSRSESHWSVCISGFDVQIYSQLLRLSTYSGVGRFGYRSSPSGTDTQRVITGSVLAQTLAGRESAAGKKIRDEFVTVMVIAPKSDIIIDPDVVQSIVHSAVDVLAIDQDKVYITGYSMGCRGTLRAVITHPDLFAAAACSAGYAEDTGDKYLKEDKSRAQGSFDSLGRATSVPIAFGYGTSDNTTPGVNTLATYNHLEKLGATCNAM